MQIKKGNPKIYKRLIICVVILVFFFSPLTQGLAEDYHDQPLASVIEAGVEDGLINLDGGDFQADDVIKKYEFARLVNGYLGLDKIAEKPFADLSADDLAYESLLVAKEAGYLRADEDNRIFPGEPLRREQAIGGVSHLLNQGLMDKEFSLAPDDWEDVDSPWRDDLAMALEYDWVTSDEQSLFRPKDFLTKGQAADFLHRITGTRLFGDQTYGDLIEELEVKGNISVYGKQVTLQKLSGAGTLYVFGPASGGELILNRVNWSGDLVVLGAKDYTIELRQSELFRLVNAQTSGEIQVSRDSASSIGSFIENAPITLSVVQETSRSQIPSTQRGLKIVVISFVLLLMGLMLMGKKAKTSNYFITAGTAKYVAIPATGGWKELSIRNRHPEVATVERRENKFRIEGVSQGKTQVDIIQTAEPMKEGSDLEDQANKPWFSLQVVVVDRPKPPKETPALSEVDLLLKRNISRTNDVKETEVE